MDQRIEFTREIVDALAAPFPEDEIEFLPRAHSNGKALGLPYIDARSVMRRLDAAVGPGNWSFDFDLLSPDGKMVRGRLTVLGTTKCDAGEASTEDEILKSAVSDALKRCAVHFGIGRYLYYLPRVWAPSDAQKRRFLETPRLDPAAVHHALSICGVSAHAGNGHRPEAQARRAAAAATEGSVDAARKSTWSAGPGGNAAPNGSGAPVLRVREGGAPESSGDRAAGAAFGPGAPESGPGPGEDTKPRSREDVKDAQAEGAAGAPAYGAPSQGTAPQPMVCGGADCGKALTKGQHDVSQRAFGQPLCPACQKLRARAA